MSHPIDSSHEYGCLNNGVEFKLAFSRIPICLMIVSPEGMIKRANKACTQLFKIEARRLYGASLSNHISHGLLPKNLIDLYKTENKYPSKTIEFKNRLGTKFRLRMQRISPPYPTTGVSTILMIQNDTERLNADLFASELSNRIIQAHEEEKQMVSQEIHDTISQALAALKIAVQTKTPTHELKKQVDQLIIQSRNLTHHLRPEIIGEQGLVSALKSLIVDLKQRYKKRIQLKTNTNKIDLPPTIALQLYRITQESITNAGKHAGATRIIITLHKRATCLTIHIVDNGKGFDRKALINSTNKPSLGLKIMEERAKRIEADFQIRSQISKGTQIKIVYRILKKPTNHKKTMV